MKNCRCVFWMLVACFALWGLLNNMTDNLVPAFQRIFSMDQSRAALVQVAFYGAYAVLALFASSSIRRHVFLWCSFMLWRSGAAKLKKKLYKAIRL